MMKTFQKCANLNFLEQIMCSVLLVGYIHNAVALYEGDSCKTHNKLTGICSVDLECKTIELAIVNKEISIHDIVHCGYLKDRELICCPIETLVRTITVTERPTPVDINLIFNDNAGINNIDTGNTNRNNSTIITTHVSANKNRPAVEACRLLDQQLSFKLNQHILGGTNANRGEYPHMAAIGYNLTVGEYIFDCGGTLIHDLFVLTAAHCILRRESVRMTMVRLGVVEISQTDEYTLDIPIETTYTHPDYKRSQRINDVGLVRLQYKVKFNEYIFPTCLYSSLDDPEPNAELYVTGWGLSNENTRDRASILQQAKLDIEPLHRCQTIYKTLGYQVTHSFLCTNHPASDACEGDSGGPLVLVEDPDMNKYRVVGIVSSGVGCRSGIPSLFMRVAAYLDYIEKIVWPED